MGECKAESRPAIAACCQRSGLGEILKQLGLLFGGQADTGIGDGKLDPVTAVRHLAHAQRDLALFRELTGVGAARQLIERILLGRRERQTRVVN